MNTMIDGHRSEYRAILGADVCIFANGETASAEAYLKRER